MASLQRIIWLASFPKSGNTWMRVLLANYFMPQGQAPDINALHQFTTADVRQDFFDRVAGRPFSKKKFSDWLKLRPRVLRAIAASKPGHHFVKTHSKIGQVDGISLILPDVTAGAIYVMRNPFDLVLSYARHMGDTVDRTIEIMMDRRAMSGSPTGIFEFKGRWDEHVTGWATAPGLGAHVVRYEDLLEDTEAELHRLMVYLKAPIDDKAMARAIEAASFGNLQKQEAAKGFKERPAGMAQFFATGRAGGWREKLTPDQVARIRKGFISTLKTYYPEMLEETAAIAEKAGSM